MADIDFTGRANIKNNIMVNRLEAENNVYTLKNIELEFNTANTGLINNVKTSIKNIGFENITLTSTASSGSYFGVIASNDGNVENLQYTEITINANGINYIGMIGSMASGNIKDIELTNITIDGNSYIGGVVGNLNISVNTTVDNITGDNVTIVGNGSNIGGIVGYQNGNGTIVNNLKIRNSNNTGRDYIGGIIRIL